MHKQKQRYNVQIPDEADAIVATLNVPSSVRGALEETLREWWEAAKEAGEDLERLEEWVGELNQSFHASKYPLSTLLKVYLEDLRHETDVLREHAVEIVERRHHERIRERQEWERSLEDRRVIGMRDETGKKIRRCMAHRAGRTHRTAPKIVTKW